MNARAANVPPIASPALGRQAASGFMLMSAQSIVTRALTFAAQFALAKLLFPDDFGLFAVAMGVVGLANVLQQIGVREILVSHPRRFDRWCSCALWIALAVSLATAALIAIAAPVASWYYTDHRLLGLLLVLAAAQPWYSVTAVHEARLQIELRFKALAGFNLVQGVLTPLLMIVAALAGAGVYSFVLPRFIVGLVRAVMIRSLTRVPFKPDPQLRRWRFLLAPGAVVMATALVQTIAPSLPALILGKVIDKHVAGYFAFAFNITLQGVLVLAITLDNVMFPTLGRLVGEPARQLDAFLRVTRTLTAVMAPMCLLQAVLAEPGLHLLFKDKWNDSIPLIQILSVGMTYLAVFIPAGSLLLAQKRFVDRLKIGAVWAVAFALLAAIGVVVGGAVGVALALALVYLLSGLHTAHAAVRPIGGSIAAILSTMLRPHLAALLAAAAGWAVLRLMPADTSGMLPQILRLSAAGAAFGFTQILALRFVDRRSWNELMGTLSPIVHRLTHPHWN